MSKSTSLLLLFLYCVYSLIFYIISRYDENETRSKKYMFICISGIFNIIFDALTYTNNSPILLIMLSISYYFTSIFIINSVVELSILKTISGFIKVIGLFACVGTLVYAASIFLSVNFEILSNLTMLIPLLIALEFLIFNYKGRVYINNNKLLHYLEIETYLALFTVIFLGEINQIRALLGNHRLVELRTIYIALTFVIFQLGIVWVAKISMEIINLYNNERYIDYLTGLYNRRYFFDKLTPCSGKIHIYALAILDIDYFKKVNDELGHMVGDQILISVSEVLKSMTDETMITARLGGEEFVIAFIMKNNYYSILENIRKSIESDNSNNISVTISCGLVVDENGEYSLDELYTYSDQSLYKSKDNGRNQIVIFANENQLVK